MNPRLLEDRVAIVTGGGRNVGRGIAVAMAAAGARVVVASRNAANLAETVRRIEAEGGEAIAVPTDVTEPAQVERLVERTLACFGGLDVMAAIAGGGAIDAPIDRLDPADFERIFRQNVTSTFLCARAVLPQFRKQNAGAVITCAGGGAFHPVLGPSIAAYACAKAAVCRLTDQLTAELWETGIRVNCIDPGLVWDEARLAAIELEERRSGAAHPERAQYRSPACAGELATWLASQASAPVRGRLVSVYDAWWRDPARVREVESTLHLFRLRRHEA